MTGPDDIIVLDRTKAIKYSYKRHEETSAVISINDIGTSAGIAKTSKNNIQAILRLQFDDVEAPDPNAITDRDAEIISKFVKNNKDVIDKLIIHCYAGQSRSAGCAAAVMKSLYNDDSSIRNSSRYDINKTVYNKVLQAMTKQKDYEYESSLQDRVQDDITMMNVIWNGK